MHRFYKPDISGAEKSIILTGNDFNHIANVLRLSVNDEITVGDGSGRDYLCRISNIDYSDSGEVEADIIDIFDSNAELPADIYIFQGVPKGDKLELIIQKTVELGAYKIIPVMMERTVVKLDDKKKAGRIQRYNKIAESAAKQSGRGIVPVVGDYMTFKEAADFASDKLDYVIMPYESAEGMDYSRNIIGSIVENVRKSSYKPSVGIFIGPEGGFSVKEVDIMKENGASIISLGHRILRTETAGMTVMSILSYLLDE